jgi:hypothetical protein
MALTMMSDDRVIFISASRHHAMPRCVNDPKAFYTGSEPSPKGKGYCAHAMRPGSRMTGQDGRGWEVRADKNGRLSWRRRAHSVAPTRAPPALHVAAVHLLLKQIFGSRPRVVPFVIERGGFRRGNSDAVGRHIDAMDQGRIDGVVWCDAEAIRNAVSSSRGTVVLQVHHAMKDKPARDRLLTDLRRQRLPGVRIDWNGSSRQAITVAVRIGS